MNDSNQPVALVTGGGTGIGAACCERLAEDGFQVLIHCRSSVESAHALAARLPAAEVVQADLGDLDALKTLVSDIRKRIGRLDVLVNNAGYNVNAPSVTMKVEDYDAVQAMARGSWFLTKLVLRQFMLRARRGRIITISSVVGHTGNAGQAPYTMAKAGLDAMTRSLAKEVADSGILVNSIAPGFIETDMTDELPGALKIEALRSVPMGRMGKPDEIADVVSFLATRANYIHGSVLHVNGGLYGG